MHEHRRRLPDTLHRAGLKGTTGRLDAAATCAVLAGLLVMSGGFFLFPDYGGVARAFYLLVLLPTIIASPWWVRRAWHPSHMALFLLPAAYLALSTGWAALPETPGGRSAWYLCKPLLFLAALLLAYCTVLPRWQRLPRVLVQYLTLVALAAGLYALNHYLQSAFATGKWPRMAGMSLRGDINVTAALYGVNCLFCAWGLLYWGERWRWPLILSLLVSMAVALLSRSKVPLLCGLASCAWLAWAALGRGYRRRLLLLTLPLLAALPLVYFIYFERVPFLDRPEGYSLRLDLWSQALYQASGRPWFGHGLGSVLELQLLGKPFDSHAHNFLLDTLRYGGVVGASLLLVQLLVAAAIARRLVHRNRDYLPVALWLLAGVLFLLTNGQQPLVKPHHTWFFYWLPLGLLLAGDACEAHRAPEDSGASARATQPSTCR